MAKTLSYTKAARNLFITQPAVTNQVKAFEDVCGLKFFTKKGKRIYLTEEGEALYNSARNIFEYEKETETVIEHFKNLRQGILRLGSTKTFAEFVMSYLTKKFHEQYPQFSITVNEGSSLSIMNSLLDARNDVAIISKVINHPDINFIRLIQPELVFIMSPNHPLAQKKTVSLETLLKEPIILKEKGSGTRKTLDELFKQYNCLPNILMETGNTGFILRLVKAGEGISFLVKGLLQAEIKKGNLTTVPVKNHRWVLNLCAAHLKNQQFSPPAEAFLKILQECQRDKFGQGAE